MSAVTPKADIAPLELERPHSAARLHEEAFHPGAGRIWCRRAVGAMGSMRRASTSYADDLAKRKSRFFGDVLCRWHDYCCQRGRGREGFMNRLLMSLFLLASTAPLYAQAQQPNAAKFKADAQKVVSTISRDKLKTQTYCEIAELNDQIDQEENPAKAEELSQKIDNLEGKLGPDFMALVHRLSDIDPDSRDAQEIRSTIEALNDLCDD
jgi:hypothetical protein